MTDPKPPHRDGQTEPVLPPTLTLRRKRAEDTSAGCRALAAADLLRADEVAVDHVRWRYRHSANAWLERADMLDRLEAKFQERVRRAAP